MIFFLKNRAIVGHPRSSRERFFFSYTISVRSTLTHGNYTLFTLEVTVISMYQRLRWQAVIVATGVEIWQLLARISSLSTNTRSSVSPAWLSCRDRTIVTFKIESAYRISINIMETDSDDDFQMSASVTGRNTSTTTPSCKCVPVPKEIQVKLTVLLF